MAAELIIAPEAQQDIDEAYSWYEDRRPGLGEEFLGCADPVFSQLGVCPNCMQKSTKNIAVLWLGDFRMPFFTSIPMGR
jgi:toxin ParE1/3/4